MYTAHTDAHNLRELCTEPTIIAKGLKSQTLYGLMQHVTNKICAEARILDKGYSVTISISKTERRNK